MKPDDLFCEHCPRDGGSCIVCYGTDPHSLDPAGYYERKTESRFGVLNSAAVLVIVLAVGGVAGYLVAWLVP